jgi:FtsP/CotA-like multicopper oxidase with cupredoxin domain
LAEFLWADSPQPTLLRAVRRTIDVNGRAAGVFGLMQDDGTHGVRLDAGRDFDVALPNQIGEPTLIHWHGMTPPWPLDGVPENPAPMLKDGETRRYGFPAGSGGTHWMHADTLQEQNLLAAPLIVRSAVDMQADEQEVVVLLHDFSFKSAEELLAGLTKGKAGHGGMHMHGGMTPGKMKLGAMAKMMRDGGMMSMDVNDIDYDAYLANDRTLADPETVKVEPGGKVRLRIINGATSTGFTIDTGIIEGALIAVDGQPVNPVAGSSFPVLMGQRLDTRLSVPREGGAFPILALPEGARERAGIILATPGATIAKLGAAGDRNGPIIGLDLEARLRAIASLADRKPARRLAVTLTGGMADYEWGLFNSKPLTARQGERIEIAIRNMSMMTHPIHLHGHHFQVVAIDGERFGGALRDTVAVPHMMMWTASPQRHQSAKAWSPERHKEGDRP